MRHDRLDCFINNGQDSFSNEFLRSLRFSTHCNYYISKEIFDTSSYLYFNHINNNNKNKNKNNNNKCYINLCDNRIQFGKEAGKSIPVAINHEFILKKQRINTKYNQLNLMVLSDCDSNLTVLSIINSESFEVIDHNEPSLHSDMNDLMSCISHRCLFDENILLRIQLRDINNENELLVKISDEMDCKEFEVCRSVGINIPLLVIQTLYERKVKTFKFISGMDTINFEKPSYLGQFDNIYFDLDETLLWSENETEIKELVSFLKEAYEKKYTVKLLTRHEKDINESLCKINLPPELFDEIIKVEKEQMKSDFVSGDSIFIDNEFPQRYDVNFTGNIPSFDLDQIDFLSL